MEFYNTIAGVYDVVTHEAARQQSAQQFVEWLLQREHIETALDAACGAGLFSIELARRDVRTIGLDVSEDMLTLAREKAALEHLDIQWFCEPMQASADTIGAPIDAIICMGNSIPHLLKESDLNATLNEFARLLKPGKPLVLHLLNYSKVLANKERIVGITRQADMEFVRFYDFAHDMLRFNVMQIDWATTPPISSMHSTMLKPWRVEELIEALHQHSFAEIETYADLECSHFDEYESETLTLFARKAN